MRASAPSFPYALAVVLLGLGLCAASGVAAAEPTPTEQESRERFKAVAEQVKARRILREHAVGVGKATEAEVAKAQATVRAYHEARARAVAGNAAGGFTADLKAADAEALAKLCEGVFGGIFASADDLADAKITLRVDAPDYDAFQEALRVELRRQKIFIDYQPDGARLTRRDPARRGMKNR